MDHVAVTEERIASLGSRIARVEVAVYIILAAVAPDAVGMLIATARAWGG